MEAIFCKVSMISWNRVIQVSNGHLPTTAHQPMQHSKQHVLEVGAQSMLPLQYLPYLTYIQSVIQCPADLSPQQCSSTGVNFSNRVNPRATSAAERASGATKPPSDVELPRHIQLQGINQDASKRRNCWKDWIHFVWSQQKNWIHKNYPDCATRKMSPFLMAVIGPGMARNWMKTGDLVTFASANFLETIVSQGKDKLPYETGASGSLMP